MSGPPFFLTPSTKWVTVAKFGLQATYGVQVPGATLVSDTCTKVRNRRQLCSPEAPTLSGSILETLDCAIYNHRHNSLLSSRQQGCVAALGWAGGDGSMVTGHLVSISSVFHFGLKDIFQLCSPEAPTLSGSILETLDFAICNDSSRQQECVSGLGSARLCWAGLSWAALRWAGEHGSMVTGHLVSISSVFSLLIERYFSHFSVGFSFHPFFQIFLFTPCSPLFSTFLFFILSHFLRSFIFLWFFFLLPPFFFFSLSFFIPFHSFLFFLFFLITLFSHLFSFLFLPFSHFLFFTTQDVAREAENMFKKDIQKILASRDAEEMRPEEVTEKSVAVQPAAKKKTSI